MGEMMNSIIKPIDWITCYIFLFILKWNGINECEYKDYSNPYKRTNKNYNLFRQLTEELNQS